ncbi:NAD-dependent epimerase/dehydratase family protein [Lentzea albida]|uniref:NAD dependent epimerase/dehydratase family protein n=1 Tax=Lentzea albida TaxID=65499 RepID=A0A1H9FCV5_9PSEU|nr:NAD(P)H-binding protein [Lentzea albida]SEQ35732.1 NAD dependent epimerase/dehydratase family protein [Lentzea albida]
MKIVIFGASGMVGQGALCEALLDAEVDSVVTVGRSPSAATDPKLRHVVHADFGDLSAIAAELADADACFYCMGVTSAGLTEAEYTPVTHDYALEAARVVGGTYVYVSGEGADADSKTMWARVKGRTENELLALDRPVFVVRPGFIQPLHGITSRTRIYRYLYSWSSWLFPVLRRVAPKMVTTTELLGRSMVALAKGAHADRVLRSDEINRVAG